MRTSGQIKGRLLIYSLNGMGPRIDPCGAASVHSAKDEHVSLILACSFLEFKRDSIHALPEKLSFDSLD